MARFHVDRWEGWERPRRRLVVECCLGTGAASRIIPSKEERPSSFVRERRGLELVSVREKELQRAVGVGTRSRDVEAGDGGNVIGRKNAVIIRTERLVGLLRGDLGYVVRVLELAFFEIGWAPSLLAVAPFVVVELALRN